MKKADKILSEAMTLPTKARATLALRILETLEDLPADEDAEAEWAKEINRRIEALKTGRAKTVSAEEALSSIEARLRRKK